MNALPRVVWFLDLDDTLFQTRRKCPPDAALMPATEDRGGATGSWQTLRQNALWETIARSDAEIVPVSARSAESLARVHAPRLRDARWACLDFGATLIADGQPDAAWQARTAAVCVAAEPALRAAFETGSAWAQADGDAVEVQLVMNAEHGLPLYVTARDYGAAPRTMETLRALWGRFLTAPAAGAAAADPGFFLHDNHTLALVPEPFDKAHAVAEVQRRLRQQHHDLLSIGLADSRSDARYLALCDFLGAPAASPLGRDLLGTNRD